MSVYVCVRVSMYAWWRYALLRVPSQMYFIEEKKNCMNIHRVQMNAIIQMSEYGQLSLANINEATASTVVMIRYIKNIDISLLISIYRIVSHLIVEKYHIFRYMALSFIYHDNFDISRYITPKVYIFYYCITKKTRINGEDDKLTEAN